MIARSIQFNTNDTLLLRRLVLLPLVLESTLTFTVVCLVTLTLVVKSERSTPTNRPEQLNFRLYCVRRHKPTVEPSTGTHQSTNRQTQPIKRVDCQFFHQL